MTRITFLGTGGGRFSTITQRRATGGILVEDGNRLHIDPGPGALVHLVAKGFDPQRLDGVLVSHCHPDHYNDAEILVEAMTSGGNKKRGLLLGSVSVMEGIDGFSAAVSPYHQEKVEICKTMRKGDIFRYNGTSIEATPAVHSDPTTIGFRLATGAGAVSYTSDTILDPEVVYSHKKARVLIMSVTRPFDAPIPHHLHTGDAIEFVEKTRPEMAVFTHFGMKFEDGVAEKEALMVEKQTGVRTIAAADGMVIQVGREISVQQ